MNTVATQIAVIRRLSEEQRRVACSSAAESAEKLKQQQNSDEFLDVLDAKSQQALELLNQRTGKKVIRRQKILIFFLKPNRLMLLLALVFGVTPTIQT